MDEQKRLSVNGKEYVIVKLLGKGKGGYSYLALDGDKKVVLKQIHHEPCSYYSFGNKIEAEINDYKRLQSIGISMPKMIDVDVAQERIVKEYIDGKTVYDMVRNDELPQFCIDQVKSMCALLYAANTNIDYFPTNFVLQDGVLYYIDYECNDYMSEWDFENWGIKYWSKTPEFLKYVEEHN
ncbi:MAG: hypothetical protein K2M48_03500 [Clostridiales bacterium]|nr:hypothetical protein [Clostridiales bacterium]